MQQESINFLYFYYIFWYVFSPLNHTVYCLMWISFFKLVSTEVIVTKQTRRYRFEKKPTSTFKTVLFFFSKLLSSDAELTLNVVKWLLKFFSDPSIIFQIKHSGYYFKCSEYFERTFFRKRIAFGVNIQKIIYFL